ncbi:TATA-box-binding protein [Natrinema halophilum]|uniref:TATA-box-binding protein C n=1 Tax=Natrinema halophilum TaxID=1699371 RepID=A0A7D5KZD0_9EURY|nr:TATA-box-binding protein C [Natrinema halophilum]QLG48960.1 TATA-box-binding protein C [Natrinema halophilum]
MVEIVNIVASGHVGRELDLVALQSDLDAHERVYEPERFPGLQLRFEEGSAVLILYSSGSYSIMGAKSEEELENIYIALSEAVGDLGVDIIDTGKRPEVQNLICRADIRREVDLSALSVGLGLENVEYEPEQSPFLFYWPEELDCLITIPSNGAVSITGIETMGEAEQAFAHLQNRIEELFQQE